MNFLFIIGISLVQFALYKYKTKLPNFVILLILLICYFFIFPKLFYPEPRTDGINCGMPILGITFVFWIFETIAGIMTHIIWKLKTIKRKAHKHNNGYNYLVLFYFGKISYFPNLVFYLKR